MSPDDATAAVVRPTIDATQRSTVLLILRLYVVSIIGLCMFDLLIRSELGGRVFNQSIIPNPEVIEAFPSDSSDHAG